MAESDKDDYFFMSGGIDINSNNDRLVQKLWPVQELLEFDLTLWTSKRLIVGKSLFLTYFSYVPFGREKFFFKTEDIKPTKFQDNTYYRNCVFPFAVRFCYVNLNFKSYFSRIYNDN